MGHAECIGAAVGRERVPYRERMGTIGDAGTQWTIEVLEPQGIVRTTAEGELDLVLVIRKAVETLEAAHKGEDNFLIDDRRVKLKLSTLELYELPGVLTGLGLSKRSKVAVVHTVVNASSDDFIFFETVATNLGFRIRLFGSIDEAMIWLQG